MCRNRQCVPSVHRFLARPGFVIPYLRRCDGGPAGAERNLSLLFLMRAGQHACETVTPLHKQQKWRAAVAKVRMVGAPLYASKPPHNIGGNSTDRLCHHYVPLLADVVRSHQAAWATLSQCSCTDARSVLTSGSAKKLRRGGKATPDTSAPPWTCDGPLAHFGILLQASVSRPPAGITHTTHPVS